MDPRVIALITVSAAAMSLAGCHNSSGGSAVPELASPTLLPAATVFLQTVAATDGDGGPAPDQANNWDLDEDFSINDGFDDQFDGALELSVDVLGTVAPFPFDQTYAELTAFGPELDAGDGVMLVSFTTDPGFIQAGTTSAALHPVPDARLQQTLDLTTAVAPISLGWSGTDASDNQNFSDEPFFMQVVVRDGSGTVLDELYRNDQTGTTGVFGTATLDAFAGLTVVLSFEQSSTSSDSTIIDEVSVIDANLAQFATNGDFEAGWTVPAVMVAQNVTSGVRTLNGLDVQRSFYAQPNQLFGRSADVFFNPTGSAIDATVIYSTNLGSDGSGIIYVTPGAAGRAITSWDGDNSDRDIGLVHGVADVVTFLSDDALGSGNGDDGVEFRYNISVPAGGGVTLVNFVIMTGTDTADTAVDITALATQVDAKAVDIAKNFRTRVIYQRGMTQQQLDTLLNF